MNPQLYFILFSFIFGIVASAIVAVYDRKKMKEEAQQKSSGAS